MYLFVVLTKPMEEIAATINKKPVDVDYELVIAESHQKAREAMAAKYPGASMDEDYFYTRKVKKLDREAGFVTDDPAMRRLAGWN